MVKDFNTFTVPPIDFSQDMGPNTRPRPRVDLKGPHEIKAKPLKSSLKMSRDQQDLSLDNYIVSQKVGHFLLFISTTTSTNLGQFS